MRRLRPYHSEIGVAISRDQGATWQQHGTALRESEKSLSSPFVVYDAPSRSYVMFPDLSRRTSKDIGLLAYRTSSGEFPRGWHRMTAAPEKSSQRARRLADVESSGPGRPAHADGGAAVTAATGGSISSDSGAGQPWGPPAGRGYRYEGTVAVQFQGRWWIFTTLWQPRLLPWLPPRPVPLVFTAKGSLLTPWRQHAMALLSGSGGRGAVGLPSLKGAAGPEWLRPAGRPVVWRGALHRWAHSCRGDVCSPELLLLAATAANQTHFAEEVVARYSPGADRSWHAQRLGHADVWPLPADGTGAERWAGLVSGDRYADGMHHFLVHEMWFVELKVQLRNLVAAQLVLVLTALAVQTSASAHRHERSDRPEPPGKGSRHHSHHHTTSPRGDDVCGGGDDFSKAVAGSVGYHHRSGGSGGGGGGVGGSASSHTVLLLALLMAWMDRVARWVVMGLVKIAAWWDSLEWAVRQVAAQPAVQFLAQTLLACGAALALGVTAMLLAPAAVPCPRWTVVVRPFASSPYFMPERPYVDAAAPYDVSNVTLVSGCTMSFMDRLENLVGSLQYWEPDRPIVLYDLGFTSEQLAQARCWKDVSLMRFPYEDYPAHVREIGNYAFKPLVFQHALKHLGPMLWIDCGLEVRGPLDSMRATMARNGHVSAQQSMAPADFPYTEQYTVPFFKFPPAEYERVKNQPFCAGGLQGFVPGSAAERLVLQPAVACALDANCISPPGHTQKKHMYDQTALTLHIRMYNFSSCMPRETHCTSAVKKTSWDATASSEPIVIASRRHRWPKPYQHRVISKPQCRPDPDANPWRSVSSEHPETVAKSSSLLFKVGFVYGQAAGDLLIQASCCLGFHLLAQSFVAAMLLGSCAYRYSSAGRSPGSDSSSSSGATSPSYARPGSNVGYGSGLSWLCRVQPLVAALVLLVLLMGLSLVTTCRAE